MSFVRKENRSHSLLALDIDIDEDIGINVFITLLQEMKKSIMTTSSKLEYDFINAVCWDLRVKVF